MKIQIETPSVAARVVALRLGELSVFAGLAESGFLIRFRSSQAVPSGRIGSRVQLAIQACSGRLVLRVGAECDRAR